MNRLTRAILITDGTILVHGFMRPVWYIDHRWHKNQYDQAAMVMSAALAFDVAGIAAMIIHQPNLTDCTVLPLMTVVVVWMWGLTVKQLGQASKDFERVPDKWHRSQAIFHFITFPPVRLLFVVMGSFIVAARIRWVVATPDLYEFTQLLSDCWLPLIGCGLYIAGVPHSPLGRKKKKEREPLFTPLPSAAPT